MKQSTLNFDQTNPEAYLASLNDAQRKAVIADCNVSLQILAGPGSGKTRVLTSRVAYMLQHHFIDPTEMIVVTFTNKAANEMKLRLAQLVGNKVVDKLMMGTFHSVCVRYLRKYGKLIELPTNFVIADRDDCLGIIKRAVNSTDMPDNIKDKLKPAKLADIISQCKSKEQSPSSYRQAQGQFTNQDDIARMEAIYKVYVEYQDELERTSALDFDDLLLKGLLLFTKFPRIVSKIRCVLIDEFQDTNATQYNLVRVMAHANRALTTVGDPDQSIYGWRSADVENLEKMARDFSPVTQIYLEQNYRSTAAILGAAMAIVQQDKKRINKGLKASHVNGSNVVIHHAGTAFDEAQFIAAQIKHLRAHTGNLIEFGDVAILLRYGALSRNIEVAFQKESIPYRMVGGHKFFDRAEVKDMISYLQLADNDSYQAAFMRVINVPKRGFGEKTLKDLETASKKKKLSLMNICIKLIAGQTFVTLTSLQKNNLKNFVQTILDVKALAEQGMDVPGLITKVVESTNYEAYLERTHGPDAKERLLNIEELKSFATIVGDERADGMADEAELEAMRATNTPDAGNQAGHTITRPSLNRSSNNDSDDEIEILQDSGFQDSDLPASFPSSQTISNPLRTFLAMSMLATDTDTKTQQDEAKEGKQKVTLTTVHAAKGLEWPVIFVPACETDVFPFYRSATSDTEIDEESAQRMAGASTKSRELSPFIKNVPERYQKAVFSKKLQKITAKSRAEIAKVLGREAPDEQAVQVVITTYNQSLPEELPTYEYDPLVHSTSRYSNESYISSGGFQQNRYGGGQTLSHQSANNQSSWTSSSTNSANRAPQTVPSHASGFASALSTLQPVTSISRPVPIIASSSSSTFGNTNNTFGRASNSFRTANQTLSGGYKINTSATNSSVPPRSGGSSIPLAPFATAHKQGEIDQLPAPPPRQPWPAGPPRSVRSFSAFKPPRMSGTASTRPSIALGTPIEIDAIPDDVNEAMNEEFEPEQQSAVDVTAQVITQDHSNSPIRSNSPLKNKSTTSSSTFQTLIKLDPQGLPNVPETRSSKISDAVLVNPEGNFESVPADLLQRWTQGERKRFLDPMAQLSKMEVNTSKSVTDVVDLTTTSSDGDPFVDTRTEVNPSKRLRKTGSTKANVETRHDKVIRKL
ncbi:ATP-dependent DNA helicase srs2 [Microbotryomycetes sp. JL221]|nr:ATP-dependent DNA helicase srs2 [Microbotryomycetes sp. JL221]